MANAQTKATYWILTIPQHGFVPYLPPSVQFIKGQLETGTETGYKHWQLYVVLDRQCKLGTVKRLFGDSVHAEATRSSAAEDYCFKSDTRVEGTQFQLGERKLKRNDRKDWQKILDSAKSGKIDEIPPDVVVRNYMSLKRICVDFARPSVRNVLATVYWGPTSTGKSYTAWREAGMDAFCKDPLTKFWDGYCGESAVVIDEFRGVVSISNILRWLDNYPCRVETKGGSSVLRAEKFWITSNLHPRDWYPGLDTATQEALLRRLRIVEMHLKYVPKQPIVID